MVSLLSEERGVRGRKGREKESGTVREKGSGESRDERGMEAGRNGKMAWEKKETTVVR